MTSLLELLKNGAFEKSLVIGYFGGTNYGDELLLEIFQNLLFSNKVKSASIYYTHPEIFPNYHHNFGYNLINPNQKLLFIQTLLKSKSIVIGGGGLWGLDSNFKILVLGLLLLFAKSILRKKVYLVSVGYYNSANWFGRQSARLVAWSANIIFARDNETRINFSKFSKNVIQDKDLSSYVHMVELSQYDSEAEEIVLKYKLRTTDVLFGIRRFHTVKNERINEIFKKVITAIPHKKRVVMSFEDLPESHELLEQYRAGMANKADLSFNAFNLNPLALYVAFQKAPTLKVIAAQYHVQIMAAKAHLSIFPVAYDNKLIQAHLDLGLDSIKPEDLDVEKMVLYINNGISFH